MNKKLTVFLALLLALSLCACGSSGIYIHDAPEATAPAPTEAPAAETAAPSVDVKAILGSPVVLSVSMKTDSYGAPDGSGKTILRYGYDTARVYLADNPKAAEAINQFLARQDEIYYSGTGTGDGVNAILEQATDNYSYALNTGAGVNIEFSCFRAVYVERGDSRVLSLRYRVNSYTGGAHGLYSDRSYVFDTATGRLLTLDDLSADRPALEKALLDMMTDTVQNDVRYQPLIGYVEQFTELTMEDALKALIREGSWILGEKGLTVFSDINEIGSYADGVVRFTLPYEELDGLLLEQWMPMERPVDGSLSIVPLDKLENGTLNLFDKVTVSGDGQEFCVFAEGAVYDVSVDSVTYISDEVGFYQTETHWYGSYLSDNGIQIQTMIPEGMPNVMIRYLDAAGQSHSFLVTQSGEDGSVLLLEEEMVEAVG